MVHEEVNSFNAHNIQLFLIGSYNPRAKCISGILEKFFESFIEEAY